MSGVQLMKDLRFTLGYSTTFIVLDNAPDGWNEELLQWERSPEFWGMFRSYSIPLKFVNDGATFLRRVLYTYGYEANVSLQIEKRNGFTNAWELKFTGRIDFGEFDDQPDYFEAMLIDGGLSSVFKNNYTTQYQIPLPTDKKIIFDGYKINAEIYKHTAIENKYPSYDPFVLDNYAWRIPYAENSFKDYQQCLQVVNSPDQSLVQSFVLQATQPCRVRLRLVGTGATVYYKASTAFATGETVTAEIEVVKFPLGGSVGTILNSFDPVSQAPSGTSDESFLYNATANQTGYIDLAATDAIGIRFAVFSSLSPGGTTFENRVDIYAGWNIEVEIYAPLPQITFPAFTAFSLFEAIVSAMTQGATPVKSTLLSTDIDAKNIMFTSANAVRLLAAPYDILQTSLKEYYTSLRSQLDVGIGVETISGVETLVIEYRDYFNNSSQAYDAGDVRGLTVSLASELIYDAIEVGERKQEYDSNNGRDEYTFTEYWKLPIERITKTLDLAPDYRIDFNGIDWTRIQALKTGTSFVQTEARKDTKSDNDVFMLKCFFGGTTPTYSYWTLDRFFIAVTGVQFDSFAYNAYFLPKRSLLRYGAYIRSILSSGTITFQGADGNFNMISQKVGDPVMSEFDNIDITTLPDAYFSPYFFTFTAPAPFDMIDGATGNPYGTIKFTWKGVDYYGFIWSVSAKFARETESTYKVLASPVNNLTNLIR